MPTVKLPPSLPNVDIVEFEGTSPIVIIGSNGSGKTRMGAFIELNAGATAHRVSAQRALNVPPYVQPRPHNQAQALLLYGTYQESRTPEQLFAQKNGNRWGNQPSTRMLDDFEHLLTLLLADESKRNRDYAIAAKSSLPTSFPPDCNLDRLSQIWSTVMPQRGISITESKIEATNLNGVAYEASQLSDGERVTAYLIGQALCAPKDGVVIIDEPEIHINRAIQSLLWDQIQKVRKDCTFIYITHDVEFAATRIGARRIWVKEYDGSSWIWEQLSNEPSFPDALLLQIVGSRRPLLFVEGDDSSLDTSIYAALYKSELVIPRQSCSKVVEATKAMQNLPALHHLKIRGVVDRDRRSDEEIAAHKDNGIAVCDVAEVENLLCIPEVIAEVGQKLAIEDAVAKATNEVMGELAKQIDQQSLSRALARIQFKMNGFGPKISNSDAARLQKELDEYVKTIDVAAMVAESKSLFEEILAKRDYAAALRYFNCKGVVSFVTRSLGIKQQVYSNLVFSIIEDDENGPLAEAMRKAAGI